MKRSYDFFEEIPGVEPAPPAAPATADPTLGEPPVTTPEPEKQYVPLERFQEVNTSLKKTREDLDELRAFQTKIASAIQPDQGQEDALDPDAQRMLDNYIATKGLVSRADLEKDTLKAQVERDLQEFKSVKSLSDEELDKVRDYAVKIGAQNKDGLTAAYNTLFQDKIVEDKVKEALAKAGKAPFAETPGSGTSPAPGASEQKPGLSIQERIRAATSKTT